MVGRSHECDYPPDTLELPAVTRPRFDVSGSSRAIDRRVKRLARQAAALDALGVYEVSSRMLRDLRPTLIVTQTQCDVCAVSLRDVEAAVAETVGCEPVIVSLQPDKLADIWLDFARVASALGVESEGDRLVAATQRRMRAVSEAASGLRHAPTVAAIEWADPLMAAGNWMPELIEMAGGRNLLGQAGQHSPWMEFETLLDADPEVIVVMPCGFGIERTLEDVALLEARPGWASLRAVREGRVCVADGNQYFNRPGPRLAESVEILAEMLHPGHFEFGHRGNAWVPAPGRA